MDPFAGSSSLNIGHLFFWNRLQPISKRSNGTQLHNPTLVLPCLTEPREINRVISIGESISGQAADDPALVRERPEWATVQDIRISEYTVCP